MDAYSRSFGKGAAIRIGARCREIRDAAEAESNKASSGTSRVLASYYQLEHDANTKFMTDFLGVRLGKAVSTKVKIGGAGFTAGAEFGSRVSLNRQVEKKGGAASGLLK